MVDEWYDGENGWAIPTADGVDDPDHRDDLEAVALYDLIEGSVAPRFYDRDERGLPTRWLEMVRHTLSSLGPKVIASRMVADYVTQLYVPAAEAAAGTTPQLAVERAAAKQRLRSLWFGVRVDHVESSGVPDSPQLNRRRGIGPRLRLPRPARPAGGAGAAGARPGEPGEHHHRPGHHAAAPRRGERGRPALLRGIGPAASTGPFGYTVRVLPDGLGPTNPAELGLVTNAEREF